MVRGLADLFRWNSFVILEVSKHPYLCECLLTKSTRQRRSRRSSAGYPSRSCGLKRQFLRMQDRDRRTESRRLAILEHHLLLVLLIGQAKTSENLQ